MKKLLFACMFLTLLACKKEKSEIVFSGITNTSGTGEIMGAVDATDWCLDDIWSDSEKAIFSSVEFSELSLSENKYSFVLKSASEISPQNKIFPAYPNPVQNQFCLNIYLSASIFKLAIVNSSFDILVAMQFNEFSGSTFYFNVSDRSVFRAETIYRVYYLFEHNDKSTEYGHGDILIRDNF